VERRFLLFLLLSFALLTANSLWNAPRGPQKPAADQAAVEPEGDAADPPVDGPVAPADQPAADLAVADEAADPGAADEAAAADKPATTNEGDELEAEAVVPLQYVTLGSIDDASPYRMLVTLTNRGAAVRRAELASPRYLDMHDRGGYLGNLELAADDGAGLLVQAVGAGTPAALAGLKVGDRLLEAGGEKLATPAELAERLAKVKRPKSIFTLAIERDDQRQQLDVTLRRRPLDVIRPESENVLLRRKTLPPDFVEPPSFLLTLQEVDRQRLADDQDELPGVDLRDANWRIVPSDAANVATFERRLPALGLTITKRYTLAQAPPKDAENASGGPAEPTYDLTLEITIAHDAGDQPRTVAYRLDGANGLPTEGWWYATKIGREWSAPGLRDVLGRFIGGQPTQLGAPAIVSGKAEAFESAAPMAYMGVDAQYFCVALIPETGKENVSWIPRATGVLLGPKPDSRNSFEARLANVTCRLFSKPLELAPGDSVTHKYTVFTGPKRPLLLEQYKYADLPAYSLDDFVYYGWFSPVARSMLWLLHAFHRVVGNYGIAIIMLTVLVRGLMFPLSRGQAKSMMKMQELRPEMDRLKERYKGDQQKQAQAMQELYRKHGVNPLAGCLPMLIQLPVFIGLYRGLAVDVELRGAPLFGQSIAWCSNLAAPDMLWNWSNVMPDFINRGDGMFSLGPYLNVLPLVTIVLWILQQKMFTPPAANEQAEMQQKIMKYMMVFMAVLFYKVPSGLCLYFIASSAWGIAERKLIPPPASPGLTAGALAASKRPAGSASKNGHSGGKPRTKPKRRP
jgi:YidC/Oxa1 family membrane protein insertase